MTTLIDGHNLIGQMPDLALDDPNDEEDLLRRLRSYRGRTGSRLVVYFDAGDTFQLSSRWASGGITVKQARTGQKADDLIVQDVRRHANPRELIVVSSDRSICDAVRQLGARAVSSVEFDRQMHGSHRKRAPHRRRGLKPEPALSKQEVQDWLALFGDELD